MNELFTSSFDNISSEVTAFTSTVPLQTSARSPAGHTALAEIASTVGLIISGIAVIANAVVLYVLFRARRQFGSSVHTLITNQSAMDLYTSIFAIPIYILMLTHGFNYNGNRILEGAICVILQGATRCCLIML